MNSKNSIGIKSVSTGSPVWWLVFKKEFSDLWIGGRALVLLILFTVVMSLTTKGRSTVKRLFPKFNRQEAEAAAGLSNAEQQTLAALLSKLEQHVAV